MPGTEISIHRFPQRLAFRAPAGLPEAIEAAARQRHTNPSEWTRQAVLRALEADGVRLGTDGRVEACMAGPMRKSHRSTRAPVEARP